MSIFEKMDYNDFVGSHGGRRTAALAGRFRQRKGLEVNDKMQQAMQAEAHRRMLAQAENQMGEVAPDAPPGYGMKPLPGPAATGGPPKAPRVGGRTSPGTTPRAKDNMPWFDPNGPMTQLGPATSKPAGPNTQGQHPWTPRPEPMGRKRPSGPVVYRSMNRKSA